MSVATEKNKDKKIVFRAVYGPEDGETADMSELMVSLRECFDKADRNGKGIEISVCEIP